MAANHSTLTNAGVSSFPSLPHLPSGVLLGGLYSTPTITPAPSFHPLKPSLLPQISGDPSAQEVVSRDVTWDPLSIKVLS